MKITTTAFKNNEAIPSQYTCDGENISPPFFVSGVPVETKSLVLIVDDPDASAGDWVHWIVWNMRPDTTEIAENTVPPGAVQGTTDFGKNAWSGPCPPSGTHHYQFKIYALDSELQLSPSAKKTDLEKAMQDHLLDSTMLIGIYQRK